MNAMNNPLTLVTRRRWLQFGGAFVSSLLLPRLLRAREGQPDNAPARQVIVIYLQGGLSHYESFDPKPDAPEAWRGQFGSIATTVPGVRFAEHLPLLAQRAHKFNVIRSVHVDSPSHNSSIHQTLTGWPYLNANTEDRTRNNVHPAIGSIVARSCAARVPGLPGYVTVPHSGQLGMRVHYASAGLLGGAYEPVDSGIPPEQADEPFSGPQSLSLHSSLTRERLGERLALRQAFDPAASTELGSYFRQAQELLARGEAARAFDLSREPLSVRERYGNHLWGQQTILARRLAEAGVPFTLVNYTLNQAHGQDWDTHVDNFNALKDRLLPPMDRAVSTLLDDLESRGLLETTLVAMFGEFGRTPIINKDAGRDHWHNVFSVMLAGGGLRSGVVLGSSTRGGDLPLDRPTHFSDIVATIYQQLGVSTNEMLRDSLNRPIPVLDGGKPIAELL
jgi:uncharacterized protein (DUF1501 family)